MLLRSFSSALLVPRRKRIVKSHLELSEIQDCLDERLLEQERYDVGLALRPIALRWTAAAMPDIRELLAPGAASLGYFLTMRPTSQPWPAAVD